MLNSHKLLLALKASKSSVKIHKHAALQIVFTLDKHFNTTLNNKLHSNVYGFVIKAQVAHACECENSNLIILNIETYSNLGKALLRKLGKQHAVIFNTKTDFQLYFSLRGNSTSLTGFINANADFNSTNPLDKRIEKSIQYIRKYFKSADISTPEIASQIYLSPSRLSALFKQETGSSISKYLLWTRLRNAIHLILTQKKKTISSIALESGFYDSSQLNKYMYQMFGISPIKLKQKSNLIQFLEADVG